MLPTANHKVQPLKCATADFFNKKNCITSCMNMHTVLKKKRIVDETKKCAINIDCEKCSSLTLPVSFMLFLYPGSLTKTC